MTKFVATGDWHIGARMGSAGEAAPRFREMKFATAARVVELAAREGAGGLFLLGDTFDGDGIGAADIERTLEILSGSPAPVFVLPGNHDWWHEGGALAAFARLSAGIPHVTVLTETGTPLVIEGLPGVTFYPCPVRKHAEVGDPTRWIPPRRPEDGRRVGLFHAALDRPDVVGRVPERVAEERDLDLALLGDWHKPVDGPDGRTFYPGSLEPGGFGEAHLGQVILASVTDDAVTPRRIEVGRLAWRRIELELESGEIGGVGPALLARTVEAVPGEREVQALRLHLSGKLTIPEMDRLDAILATERDAGWATLDAQSAVQPLGEPDLDSFEEPAIRAVAERIWNGEEDPVLRRRALAILVAKVEESR